MPSRDPSRPDADLLGRVAMFAPLGDADRGALARCFHARRWAADEVIFREGELGQCLVLVAEGELVATARAGGVGRELARYHAGEVVFASTLVERTPCSMTLLAVSPALVYELDPDAVEQLRPGAPAAALALLAAGIRGLLMQLHSIERRVEQELEQSRDP